MKMAQMRRKNLSLAEKGLSAAAFLAVLAGVCFQAAAGEFKFKKIDEKSLGLWEGDQPVLVYNFGVMSKPGVPADRNRSTYFHPIYGVDGEVLTDDFPRDHYHHRGLFWAWPHIKVDGQEYSTWDIKGIRQEFERWLFQQADNKGAFLGVENGWYVGPKKVMQEQVKLRVSRLIYGRQGATNLPAQRYLNLEFTWTPVGSDVTLAGAEGKSYGGLTFRYAPRTKTVITTPEGAGTNDLAITRLPWADLSAQWTGSQTTSGAAIFIAPDHPDYPPTWLTRHYGVLCVGWPGVDGKTFKAGEPIHCRYLVWIHRWHREADSKVLFEDLKFMSKAYAKEGPITWPK